MLIVINYAIVESISKVRFLYYLTRFCYVLFFVCFNAQRNFTVDRKKKVTFDWETEKLLLRRKLWLIELIVHGNRNLLQEGELVTLAVIEVQKSF